MLSYTRYAIYDLPDGPLGDFGARWLGWDARRGQNAPLHDPAFAALVARPATYGLHATLKPPFALAPGLTPEALQMAVADLAARTAPALVPGLDLVRLGRFLALVAAGDASGIDRIAAACVTELDAFRAPLTPAERARKLAPQMSDAKVRLLERWGYPHVLEAFRYHITLTGKADRATLESAKAALARHLPRLTSPFALDALTLLGERPDGRFEAIARYPLTG